MTQAPNLYFDTACLVQVLTSEEMPNVHFFDPTSLLYQKAKPILAQFMRATIMAGRVDEEIKTSCQSWLVISDSKADSFIREQYHERGVKMLTIFKGCFEKINYLILSALLNYKKKREDIKLFTLAQVTSHIYLKLDAQKHYPMQIIVLILKLLLEQDLIPLAIEIESGAKNLSAFDAQKVAVVDTMLQVLRAHIHPTNPNRALDFVNAMKDFNKPNMFLKILKSEEMFTAKDYKVAFIIGCIILGACLWLMVFLKIFSF